MTTEPTEVEAVVPPGVPPVLTGGQVEAVLNIKESMRLTLTRKRALKALHRYGKRDNYRYVTQSVADFAAFCGYPLDWSVVTDNE